MAKAMKLFKYIVFFGILTLVLFTIFYEDYSFNQTITCSLIPVKHELVDASLEYKGVKIDMSSKSFKADYVDRLVVANRSLYLGNISHAEDCITIFVKEKIVLKIYPNDNTSVLLEFKKHNGLLRKYKLSGYGNFDKNCKILYELTKNEVFKIDSIENL